jgi:hypothetical protein
VAAEHLLDGLRIETLEDIADRGMSGRTSPAQTEGGIQPTLMKVSMERKELPPVTTARMENSRT